MSNSKKKKKQTVKPFLKCPLCHKLFKEATTISLCLHTFCRKCIYEKLSDEEIVCCPVCKIDLGCLPVEKLRPDHSLQDIRAKIFPFKRRKIEVQDDVPSISQPEKRKERSLSSLVISAPKVSTNTGFTGKRTETDSLADGSEYSSVINIPTAGVGFSTIPNLSVLKRKKRESKSHQDEGNEDVPCRTTRKTSLPPSYDDPLLQGSQFLSCFADLSQFNELLLSAHNQSFLHSLSAEEVVDLMAEKNLKALTSLRKLKDSLIIATQEKKDLKREIKSLQLLKENLDRDLCDFKTRCASAEEVAAASTFQLEEQKQKITALERRAMDAEKELGEIKKEVQVLRSENLSLQSEVEQSSSKEKNKIPKAMFG